MGYSLGWASRGIQYRDHRPSIRACLQTIRQIGTRETIDCFGIYSPGDRLQACMPQIINLIEPKTCQHLGKGLGAWCYARSKMLDLEELSAAGIHLYDLDRALERLELPAIIRIETLRRHTWTDLGSSRHYVAMEQPAAAIAA